MHFWGQSETGKVLAVMQNTTRAENHFLSPLLICKNVFFSRPQADHASSIISYREAAPSQKVGGVGSQSFSPRPLHPRGPAGTPCSASPVLFWTPFFPEEKCGGALQLVPSLSAQRWHGGGVRPFLAQGVTSVSQSGQGDSLEKQIPAT